MNKFSWIVIIFLGLKMNWLNLIREGRLDVLVSHIGHRKHQYQIMSWCCQLDYHFVLCILDQCKSGIPCRWCQSIRWIDSLFCRYCFVWNYHPLNKFLQQFGLCLYIQLEWNCKHSLWLQNIKISLKIKMIIFKN